MPPFKRVHVIINPASGQDSPVLSVLNRVFNGQVEWDVSVTKEAGDAHREAQAAVERGVDVVVACGGDGTVMEVANGLIGHDVPLAILPDGTANVMAVELGIPRDLEQAAQLVVKPDTVMRRIDVGELDDSFFLLRLGIGWEAVMIQNADREFKQRYGNLAYPLSAIQSTLSTDSVARYRITVDGETHETDGASCMVANSGKLGLGDLTVSRSIDVEDGLLNVVVLRTRAAEPATNGASEPVPGVPESDLRPDPLLLQWQGREISIEADPPQPIISDGDPKGETPIRARVRPRALMVLVPPVALEASTRESGLAVETVINPRIRLSDFLRRPSHLLLEWADRTHRFFSGTPIHRYTEIAPGLFIGGQHTRRGLRQMQDRGITASVNLRSESDDSKRRRALGRYLHLPIGDGMEPSQEQLREGVAFIRGVVESGGKVYVHCNLGIGRAPTLAAAYLIQSGATPEDAWKRIRAVRPFVRPTRRQIEALRTFAREQPGIHGQIPVEPLP
jgi:YegS/Rv2252/BmrU family lipid kinase